MDVAAQCQDPKNNNPVFLLLRSKWGILFLSQKTVDGACLAAATYLALLQTGFSFALEWATDAGEEQLECSPMRRDVQNQGHTVLRQSLLSGLLLLFRRASKREARDYSSL